MIRKKFESQLSKMTGRRSRGADKIPGNTIKRGIHMITTRILNAVLPHIVREEKVPELIYFADSDIEFELVKVATDIGYMRHNFPTIEPYDGRYGHGYKVRCFLRRPDGKPCGRFHKVLYYIIKEGNYEEKNNIHNG